ncbi:MAG: hypothetical protein EBV34_20405 [Betaproteobacteria bacterium]|nr:hypothetical protein [Betaproteobacteria bacterium]
MPAIMAVQVPGTLYFVLGRATDLLIVAMSLYNEPTEHPAVVCNNTPQRNHLAAMGGLEMRSIVRWKFNGELDHKPQISNREVTQVWKCPCNTLRRDAKPIE